MLLNCDPGRSCVTNVKTVLLLEKRTLGKIFAQVTLLNVKIKKAEK